MAVDPTQSLLLIPISDIQALGDDGTAQPGLFALDVDTGDTRWYAPRVQRCEGRQCWSGLSAAITAAPGIVLTGGLDGQLDVFASEDGALLWSFDTLREFDAVNGVPARGGAIDTHGPVLADNLLIAVSGYGSFQETPGNALLVFAVPATAEQP